MVAMMSEFSSVVLAVASQTLAAKPNSNMEVRVKLR